MGAMGPVGLDFIAAFQMAAALGYCSTALGELLRRLQTGSVRAYAASLLLGAVLVLGYYLSR